MHMQGLLEAARTRGDRPFLHFGDESWTYAEYVDLCDRAAQAWLDAGVGPGDVAALLLPNSPHYLAALHGLACVGGIAVPMNTGYKPAEARYVLENSGAKVVLSDSALHETTLAPVLPELVSVSRVLQVDRAGDGFDGSGPSRRTALARVSEEDVAAILYTSGTSGNPKGAIAPQAQVGVNAAGLADAIDLRAGDVHFSVFPLFHVNAQTIVGAALLVGAEVVLGTRFSLTDFWPTVHRHAVTHVSYLGSVIPLLDKREDPLEAANPIKIMWGAGASAEAQARLEARWGMSFVEVYGMTEIGIVLANKASEERRPGSCGRAVGSHRLMIVDEHRQEVAAGVTGEIVVEHQPGMFHGYLGDDATTAETIRDGFVHTGDAGRRDEDGYFYFVDRYKDIIRRGGENIASADVELAVRSHPMVIDVAAVPAPDELRGEEVRVIVVLKTGQQPAAEYAAELVGWCRDRLAAYKVPRYVEIADDLPRTSTGKVRKLQLRSEFGSRDHYDAATGHWHRTSATSTTVPASA